MAQRYRAALALSLAAASLSCGATDLPVDTVVITAGHDDERADAATGEVDSDRLERRPLGRPGDVLEAVPGMVVTQHSGSGKANQYFLRGFNLDHGTDFAISVDGMPINLPSHAHGQGYADLNFLMPELVDHIHYRKGPYYADQGDFSAAGGAQLHLKRSLPTGLAQLSAGSFGYRRALFGGNRDLGGEANLFGALELGTADGPWEHPDQLRKVNALLRYAQGDDRNGLSFTGMAYQARWNATDQIPQRAVDSGQLGRFGSLDTTDGGESSRYSLSAQWTQSDGVRATRANAYLVRSRLDLFSNFTFFLDDPVNGDQFEQVDRRTVGGGGISHSWLARTLGARMQHTVGFQVRNDDIPEVALHHTVARERIATARNDSIVETSASLYYANDAKWSDWLRTQVGLRGDRYRARVDASTPQGSGTTNAGLVSPKLGLTLGPWSGVEYYASYGQGFHSNDARSLQNLLVRARGREVGLRATPRPGWQSSVSLWRLDFDSELVFAGDAGTTEPSHASSREGIEWANTFNGKKGVGGEAELTLARARFTDGDAAGPYIPGSMNVTFSGGVTYERGPFKGALRVRYFGPRALTEDNSQRSASSTLFNAQLAYAASERMGFRFEVLNLFNRTVDDITYFYASRLPGEPAGGVEDKHFHPAEPRALRLSLIVHL